MENFNQYPVGIERVLTASEFMLFCTMYNQWRLMKNEKEYYFRSFEDLSDDCTLSLRSIKTIVKEFKNKGILESVAGSKKKGHANEYRFNLSAIFALIHNDSDEIKVQNMSNKSANSAHHKEIKTKENNVKYIHISGISSNEDESNKIKNNNIISSEDKMDRMETVNEEKIEDLNVMNDTMKNNNFTSDVEAMQTDTTEISDTSKNINISDTESIEVVNEESNSVANVMNDDDNNTKDNNMIQDKTTDSSVGPDNIEGENESMNVENTEMNDTMKNNIPSEDTMKNKSIATTSIHLSVSNTTKNHEGSAAVGGGAENLRNGAGSVNSSTMDNYTTSTEKSVNTAPLYSNTASNGKVNMFYLQHGITQEEYEEAQRSFMPNSWKNLTVHGIKIDNKTVTFTEVLVVPDDSQLQAVKGVDVAPVSASAVKANWAAPVDRDVVQVQYCTGSASTQGVTAPADNNYNIMVGALYPSKTFRGRTGYAIKKARFYPLTDATYTVYVYKNDELISETEVDDYTVGKWNEVELTKPIIIENGSTYRLAIDCYDVTPKEPAIAVAGIDENTIGRIEMRQGENELTVTDEGVTSVELVSAAGAVVAKAEGNTVSLNGLTAGVYVVKAVVAGETVTRKIMITK